MQEPALGQLDFGGRVFTFVQGLVNHEKSRHIAEQVGLAKARIAANGALDGRTPWVSPRPARSTTGGWPTEEAREYIPQIYHRVIAGESLAQVCRWLESCGVTPVGIAKVREDGRGKSGQWWSRSLGQLIRNPVYMGLRCEWDKKTRTYGQTVSTCEALVDADTWARAGKRLDDAPRRGPVLAENRCALSGAARCWQCGGPLYKVMTGTGRNRTAYMRCSGTGQARKSCGAPLIRLDVAEALADEVLGALAHPVYEYREVPGNEAEIDAAPAALDYQRRQVALRGLSWDEEDAERARIRAEYDAAAATPRIEAVRRAIDTGVSYGQRWRKMDAHGRAAWLRSGELVACFTKGDADPRDVAGQRDGVKLILAWPSQDEDAAGVARAMGPESRTYPRPRLGPGIVPQLAAATVASAAARPGAQPGPARPR